MVLAAADASGKWSGSISIKNYAGESHDVPTLFILKQAGDKITGTLGPNEQRQDGLLKGRVEKNVIILVVERGSQIVNFKLEIDGESLK